MKTNYLNNRSSRFATLALACVALFSFGAPSVKAANFTSGNLAVIVAASATANNTTASVIELYPSTASQSSPVQTITIDGNSYRVSGSSTSSLYLANSADGSLIALTAHKGNSSTSASNANTLTSRGVVTINNAATVANPASWTGTSGQQTRGASSPNNSTWFIGDQNGFYTDGAIASSPSGNVRAVKAFGSVVYAMTSSTAAPFVGIISAATGGTYTALTGLPNGTTAGQDFYLIQSGSNGTTYDVLYILSTTAATAGTIAKYSLVSGTWTANGTYTTTFGGFGLAAKKSGSGADLFVTSGTGATAANVLYKLTDTAGFNASIAITTANNVSLYTTAAGTTMKGVAFAPVVAAATPTITGATTAAAFTTTYGTASTAQTFTVGGSNLSASITATAPTGFEVSSDGTTYGTTATFTQTSGSASGTLRIRLSATAVPGGTYNSQNIVLSTGATSVNIATASSGNSVSTKALTITGLTGASKDYTGTTSASVTGTAALSGFVGSDTATLNSSSASWTYATAAVGMAKTITASGYAISGGQSSYYTLTQPTSTADITARSLTITASNVTKAAGAVLTGGSGSTAFTSSGLQNSETIGSVTITYGSGAAADAAGGVYADAVVPSAATGGTFTASNYSISYTAGSITVNASPTITPTGTLAAVGTTYGTASASPTSFTVSGGNLTGDLSVTVPNGFEVSSDNTNYSDGPLALTATGGTVSSTTIYVRLAAKTGAGSYSGNVTISGGGATTQDVATVSSTVAPKTLSITGATTTNREYNGSTTIEVGGGSISGVVQGDTVILGGSPAGTVTSAAAGTDKAVAVTGYSISGASSANYALTQPTGLTATINPKALTVANAAVTSRAYDGTDVATITGTLTGVVGSDAVTFNGTGSFANADAGMGIAVASTSTINGAASGNYTLTQPVGLTGDITRANQTITFGALANKTTADASFALTASASSGGTVSYTSSNPQVATISGNTVTIVGIGTTTITASQAGNGNYNGASDVTQSLTVTVAPTTLAAGDIAVIGYNTNGSPDSFTILILKDLNPGTIFYVNDNETTVGAIAFTDLGEGEASFTVKAGQTIPSGTVFTLPWGGAAVSTTQYDWTTTLGFGLTNNNEDIYIYTASSITATTPTAFIYAAAIGTSTSGVPTGLALGTTFIKPQGTAARYKTSTAVYAGPAEVLLPAIGSTTNNWEALAPVATTDWNFNTQYLLPVVTSLSPSSVAPGGADFTMTINGSNFYTTSQVTLAGVSKTVTYVNGGQLTIPVTANEIAAVGSLGVVVTNPAPGGGSSTTVNLGVNYAPSLALTSPIDNSIYYSTIQTPTASRSFTVSGSYLRTGITITAPAGFEVSSDNSTYQSSLLLPQSGGAVADTTLYVRFNPIGVQSYNGNITVATDGVTPSPGFAVQGIASVPNNGTLAATFGDNAVSLTGTAATGTVTEYIVLAKVGSPNTDAPTGTASSLTANTVYGQGSAVGSAFVVYKGNEAPTALQVTGLTNRLRYFFTMYSRVDSAYSTGVSINGMPFATLGNVITQWDFNGVFTPVLGSGQLSTSGGVTASAFASGVGSSDLTTGTNQGVTTTSYPAQGVNPETSGPVCAVSTVGKKDIVVYWDLRHSNTSSRYTRFQYSTDGGATWTNYQATGDLTEGGLYVGNYGDTWFLQRKADLSAISAVNNNANFAFRIVTAYAPNTSTYVTAATGSLYGTNGTLRYDMLTVTGVDGVFNNAPTDITLSANTIAENNDANAPVGDLITQDPNVGDIITYSFVTGAGDTDNASFGIVNGKLIALGKLDYETKSIYSVRIQAMDQGGLFVEVPFTITVINVNEAPSVTSPGAISIAENQTAVQTVAGFDQDAGTTLAYSIEGGVDGAKFTINSSTGELTFVSAPDYEIPTDVGTNNVYDVTVGISDGTNKVTIALAVTVTDVAEVLAPSGLSYTPAMISGTVGTPIANLTPAITGAQITYSIDPALPTGLSIDPTTGVISGTPSATAASASYTVTATNAGGNTTATLTVAVVAAGSTYSGWLILNGANGSDAAFWDYVYGATAPGQLPASLRPTTVITGGNLVLTYYVRQNTLGLTVTAKKSLDLATGPSGWNIDGVTDVPVDGPTTAENGVSVQKRTASVVVSGANKKFLKLEGVQAQ